MNPARRGYKLLAVALLLLLAFWLAPADVARGDCGTGEAGDPQIATWAPSPAPGARCARCVPRTAILRATRVRPSRTDDAMTAVAPVAIAPASSAALVLLPLPETVTARSLQRSLPLRR